MLGSSDVMVQPKRLFPRSFPKLRHGAMGLLLSLLLAGCPGSDIPQTKDLLVEVEEGGKVAAGAQECPGGRKCSWSYQRGTNVTLKAFPEEGHYFAGWQGACSGYHDCSLTLDRDLRVKASFQRLVGDFLLADIASPVVVPAGGKVEMYLRLQLSGGLSVPPGAYQVALRGRLIGEGVDQVRYHHLPQRSQEDRLVVVLEGPEPSEVWTYFAAPAQAAVKLGSLERAVDFILAVTPCVEGCRR